MPFTNLITKVMAWRNSRDRGASAVEYGLLVALIAVVVAVAITTLGGTIRDKFNEVSGCISAGC